MESSELEYVGFWPRLGASLIDTVLLCVISWPILIAAYGSNYWSSTDFIKGPIDFLMSWVFPAFAIITFWMFRQTTPGKMVVSAKIVDAETGGKPTLGQLVGRYFGYFISMIPLCLGFVWVVFDRRKQGWHDKLAGTVVIRPIKREPEPVMFSRSYPQGESPPTELPHPNATPEATNSAQKSHMTSAKQANFLVKHWRGDYSLGFSYWVVGSLLTVIVLAMTAGVGSISILRELGAKTSGALILAFFGLALTLTFWQLVGIWRSADKHGQRGGKAIWANLVKVMVVIGLLRAVVDFSTQGPLISEGAKLFVGIDNTPPHAIRLLRDGTELELAGGMPFGTTDAVKKFLDAAPAIQVIHLNSQGGRMNEAYQLYKLIKERNLITYTSADCASACSIAFLAGRERYIGERGRLGFHSASIGGLSGDIAMQLNDDVRQTLRGHRVPDSFIDHALSTSPKDMWYPGTAELLRANVINSVVDSRYFGLSGVTQWRDAHKIETEMLAIPIYSALAQYDQQNYARLRDILITGIQKGRAQIEIQKDIRSIFVSELIPAYLKKAPDDALIRYWRSQIAEMRHFAKLNSQYCADFIFPQFAKSAQDLQGLLPKDLQMEDMDALATVVKGVATNPQAYGTSPQIHHDIEAVVMKVAQKYPMALKAVSNPANYKNDAGALCGGVIALYSEILAIPSSSRSGPILRYMLNAK